MARAHRPKRPTRDTRLRIACTLGPPDAAAQVRGWCEVAGQAPPTVTRTAGRLVAHFPAVDGVAERVGRLADVERGCCAFVAWMVTSDPAGVVLTVSGSPAGIDAVAQLWSEHAAPAMGAAGAG